MNLQGKGAYSLYVTALQMKFDVAKIVIIFQSYLFNYMQNNVKSCLSPISDAPFGAKLLFYYLDCKNSIKQKDSMGVVLMIGFSIEERAITLAHYIIDSKDTVRGAAKK